MFKQIKKLTHWELWPFWLIYTPLVFVWLYYWVRARAFWFFSNVNPTLEFSGFEGETKKEMFDQLPHSSYPTTIYVQPNSNFADVQQQINKAGLQLPVAVKPDIGSKGLCFRKIDSWKELAHYHQTMNVVYLVQAFIDFPLELSIFYVRMPDSNKGKITGLIAKDYLHVVGNGQQTLLQLMQQHPKAQYRMDELAMKHQHNFHQIIPAQEKYVLSMAGNHNRGANFVNLHHEIDAALVQLMDQLSLYAGQFYYGRFDLKTTSLEDLKLGKNIAILEFNGVGSEPNHIYDCGMRYGQALKTIAQHWHYMYQIGNINQQKGIPYQSFRAGIQQWSRAKAAYNNLERLEKLC